MKICENFTDQDRFSGQELLNITTIKPLNLMMIRNLLISWKIEQNRLKSPYFNYESPQVQEALKKFSNVLSRNISISLKETKKLIEDACRDTILLFASPYEYFNLFIGREELKNLSLSDFRETLKYVKINSFVLESFVSHIEKSGNNNFLKAYDLLDQVFDNLAQAPDDPDPWFMEFSSVLPLDKNILSEEFPVASAIRKSEPTAVANQQTLNDVFSTEEKQNLNLFHQNMKIQDIRKALNLNQKFMFVNSLFKGKEQEFESVIVQIESFEKYEQAFQYLQKSYDWDFESEEVEEFLEVIRKRLN